MTNKLLSDDTGSRGPDGLDRRNLLRGAAAIAAATVTIRPASAAERPLGETAVRLRDTQPFPLGPLPGSRYPDPHIEALDKSFKGSAGTGAVDRKSVV